MTFFAFLFFQVQNNLLNVQMLRLIKIHSLLFDLLSSIFSLSPPAVLGLTSKSVSSVLLHLSRSDRCSLKRRSKLSAVSLSLLVRILPPIDSRNPWFKLIGLLIRVVSIPIESRNPRFKSTSPLVRILPIPIDSRKRRSKSRRLRALSSVVETCCSALGSN